ncbi:MAG: WG repeat-containing protein, partial [Saprospiraceae bacterium]|nr:WG repeat-containing protein [Saprospiraceae bacterium]
ADYFSDGVVRVQKDGKWGLISKKGILAPPMLDNFHWCAEGKIALYANSRRGLFFVEEGVYIPCEYEEIAQINDEWVMVMKNGKWGWVDHSGKTMIPCRYDAAAPFDAEGRAWVYQFGERFRINKKGEMVWER